MPCASSRLKVVGARSTKAYTSPPFPSADFSFSSLTCGVSCTRSGDSFLVFDGGLTRCFQHSARSPNLQGGLQVRASNEGERILESIRPTQGKFAQQSTVIIPRSVWKPFTCHCGCIMHGWLRALFCSKNIHKKPTWR